MGPAVDAPIPTALLPRDPVTGAGVSACPSGAENSDSAGSDGPAVPVDVVPTEGGRWPGFPGRPVPGHLSRNLKRGAEVSRVKGYETRRELVRLHVFEGKSIPECARLMGRSYKGLHAVWRLIVAEASGDRGGGIDYRKQVKAYSDRVLRELVEVALPLVKDSAAHGAVVLKSIEQLRSLHGVDGAEEEAGPGMTLEEIGASVRVVSPLLADKLERVKALGMGQIAAGLKVAKPTE